MVNRGTMGVNTLPKTVTRQRRGCDLNPGPSAPESITLTSRLPSHLMGYGTHCLYGVCVCVRACVRACVMLFCPVEVGTREDERVAEVSLRRVAVATPGRR